MHGGHPGVVSRRRRIARSLAHRQADSDTSDVAMQHPNKSFHPTPLRVERDQAFFGIWKHTNVFPI